MKYILQVNLNLSGLVLKPVNSMQAGLVSLFHDGNRTHLINAITIILYANLLFHHAK